MKAAVGICWLALFPADREVSACADGYGVQVRLGAMEFVPG
jgi:hypothetical protein